MPDVVQKLSGFCNTLRHDGINHGDYIEQLTYLLLLKLAAEKSVSMPADSTGAAADATRVDQAILARAFRGEL